VAVRTPTSHGPRADGSSGTASSFVDPQAATLASVLNVAASSEPVEPPSLESVPPEELPEPPDVPDAPEEDVGSPLLVDPLPGIVDAPDPPAALPLLDWPMAPLPLPVPPPGSLAGPLLELEHATKSVQVAATIEMRIGKIAFFGSEGALGRGRVGKRARSSRNKTAATRRVAVGHDPPLGGAAQSATVSQPSHS